MEWYIVQSQDLHGIFSSLGSRVGEDYKAGENCLDTLREILSCLLNEDRMMRNFRRALGISQVIQKDLIPLLIHSKDNKKILDATIRVLVNLTLPVECLLPVESVSQTENGHQIITDLNCLLMSAKQEFADPRATFCLLKRMKASLGEGKNVCPDDCENIGNCLFLLRNILHIPENKDGQPHWINRTCQTPVESNVNTSNSGCSKQNLIIWNLFAQNFDKMLVHLMTCEQKSEWEVPLVQLVALIFKDQRMASLLKMLHQWLETSVSSESSEDNESNTSPQPLGSGNSSPLLTSESTSDSSDNGGGISEGHKSERTQTCPADRSDSRNSSERQFDYAPRVKEKQAYMSDQLYSSEKVMTKKIVESERKIHLNDKDESRLERKEDDEERESLEEEDKLHKMVRGQRGRVSGDADSGIFSQSSDQNFPSIGEKKPKVEKKGVVPPKSVTSSPPAKSFAASEQSDCGYATQVENQPKSLSTSSNEDEGPIAKRKPGHQKHNSKQLHKTNSNTPGNRINPVKQLKSQRCGTELRRKRLVKRARIHSTNLKAMVHHMPSDDDVSNLLKEFTLDFMSQGYGLLVSGLHIQLLSSCSHRAPGIQVVDPPAVFFFNSMKPSSPTMFPPVVAELPPPPIDTSHFFWLITFFLRFSWQLGLEFDNIRMVLSYDILSYLIYEGVGLCEEVQLALHHSRESDVKTCLRRIHLVVTAIREFVQAVETYGKMAMVMPGREGDRAHLEMLQKQMASTRDLRCLFVLLLQHCNLSIMSRQYLQDIVVTNHLLLLFLESGGGVVQPDEGNGEMHGRRRNSLIEELEMAEHITHFANVSIVQQYGRLLEAFQENGEFVNDCIFTMLHHICGEDVNRAEALFQPALLWSFSAMWETDFDICDDWSDLIEYVIYKFINNPQQGIKGKNVNFKKGLPLGGRKSNTGEQHLEDDGCSWSVKEMRDLRWFYALSKEQNKVLDSIMNLYHQKLGVKKNPKGVLKALFSQEIIDFQQFVALKNKELPGDTSLDIVISSFPSNTTEEDVEKLIADLISEGLERVVHWLQDALLEASYVKLHLKRQKHEGYHFQHSQFPVMEPVAYHYALMGQPIPIVPWGVEEHSAVVENVSFGRLLQHLGIQKPREDGIGGIYPRIPISLSPLDLLEAAHKLGKVTPGKLKFDPAELHVESEGAEEIWRGDRKHIPLPLSSPSAISTIPNEPFLPSVSNQKPIKRSSSDRHTSLTTQSGSQNSPSEMGITILRRSNVNWLNIVKQSKNPALIKGKNPIKIMKKE